MGYALASGKEICLISTEQRAKFPFDVQHRNIIRYRGDKPSDFETLKAGITARLKAILAKQNSLDAIAKSTPIRETKGLEQHEIIVLCAILENRGGPEDVVSHWAVRQDLDRMGFNNLALNLGVEGLRRKGMITGRQEFDRDGDPYTLYEVTAAGVDWLMANTNLLVLEGTKRQQSVGFSQNLDDEIPF